MKIGLFRPPLLPHSVQNYTENLTSRLEKLGVQLIQILPTDALPDDLDIYWDPGTGRPGPQRRFLESPGPLVVTFHGAANLALPIRDCFGPEIRNLIRGLRSRRATLREWRAFANRRFHTIAVSDYARLEAANCLGLKFNKIIPVYHGVDMSTFQLRTDEMAYSAPFFLHVSQYQPVKNVHAIIAAYDQLPLTNKPDLLIVAPGFPDRDVPAGVNLIVKPLSQEELAKLYSAALAFVFPSIRETFGMPILEAMACGCPVITSNVTACPEVAGDAALLVDPRSGSDLAGAMRHLAEDASLRANLRQRGLDRAKRFTWQWSAEQHLKVFEDVLRESNRK
jgi:glycosyltransferase involved in cell wall biosynthesis